MQNLIARWWRTRGAVRVDPAIEPGSGPGAASPHRTEEPGLPTEDRPSPAGAAESILHIDAGQLSRDRDAVAQHQQDTLLRIRRLQSDIQSIASRHAEARARGKSSEKAALIRVFHGLWMQLGKAEQFQRDLLKQRQLLDNLASTREFALLRHQLRQGAMAGMTLDRIRQMLDVILAEEQHERNQTTALLQEWQRHDEDAALQTQAEFTDAEAELDALSELEYQAHVQAQMQPLEAAAQRVEEELRRTEVSQPSTGLLAPRTTSGGST